MIFRNINGELVQINKYDFVNDKLYYEKIEELNKPFFKMKHLAKLLPKDYSKKTLNNKND